MAPKTLKKSKSRRSKKGRTVVEIGGKRQGEHAQSEHLTPEEAERAARERDPSPPPASVEKVVATEMARGRVPAAPKTPTEHVLLIRVRYEAVRHWRLTQGARGEAKKEAKSQVEIAQCALESAIRDNADPEGLDFDKNKPKNNTATVRAAYEKLAARRLEFDKAKAAAKDADGRCDEAYAEMERTIRGEFDLPFEEPPAPTNGSTGDGNDDDDESGDGTTVELSAGGKSTGRMSLKKFERAAKAIATT